MRVYVGGVETLYPARWYWSDGQPWDGPHGCEASPWLKDGEVNQSWGEVAGKKGLDRGLNPGYLGQCSVGDPQWFIDGQLPKGLFDTPAPPLPECCGVGSPLPVSLPASCIPNAGFGPLYLTAVAGPACFTDLGSLASHYLGVNRWAFAVPDSCGTTSPSTIILQGTPDQCGGLSFSLQADDYWSCFAAPYYFASPPESGRCQTFMLTFPAVPIGDAVPVGGSASCPGGTVVFVVTA